MNGVADPNRDWFIYVLKDPRNDEIRYVGWAVDVRRRLRDHIAHSPKESTHKARWINVLLNLDLAPYYEIIEIGNGDGHSDCERKWIAYHRGIGTRLTNGTAGGEGAFNPTEETRQKMSKSRTGRRHTDESKDKVRQAKLGVPRSEETKRKVSESLKGNVIPQHQREQHRIFMTGRKASEQTLVKMRLAAQCHAIHIRRIDDGVVFLSIKSAAESIGVSPASISEAIRKNRRCRGYYWERADN